MYRSKGIEFMGVAYIKIRPTPNSHHLRLAPHRQHAMHHNFLFAGGRARIKKTPALRVAGRGRKSV